MDEEGDSADTIIVVHVFRVYVPYSRPTMPIDEPHHPPAPQPPQSPPPTPQVTPTRGACVLPGVNWTESADGVDDEEGGTGSFDDMAECGCDPSTSSTRGTHCDYVRANWRTIVWPFRMKLSAATSSERRAMLKDNIRLRDDPNSASKNRQKCGHGHGECTEHPFKSHPIFTLPSTRKAGR